MFDGNPVLQKKIQVLESSSLEKNEYFRGQILFMSKLNVDKQHIADWRITFSRLTWVPKVSHISEATRGELTGSREATACIGTHAVSEVRPKTEFCSEQRKSMWKAVSLFFLYPRGNGKISSERSDENVSRLLNCSHCPWNVGPKVSYFCWTESRSPDLECGA